MSDDTSVILAEGPSGLPTLPVREAELRNFDAARGRVVLRAFGCEENDPLYKEYCQLVSAKEYGGKEVPKDKKIAFAAKFMLQMFQVLKLKETNVFYIGYSGSPLFKKCQSKEELASTVGYWYQVFFGFSTDINKAADSLIAGILPTEFYGAVNRDYLQIASGWYWNIKEAEIYVEDKLPENTRVFARLFDTDREDANIFKVPQFDEEHISLMLDTYTALKDLPYNEWPEEYHLQCFKDWSDNNKDVEFGMFTVLALPFMKPTIMRGSVFNVGEGHNGKSVLNGLVTSIIGSRNTTTVSGNDLGSWDFLVDLQTTWFNCPSETELEFLKENTGAFKTISAHETLSIRKKHGDASVPVDGAFPTVFNINKIPDLGDDAPAILSRMFINNFDVDFEASGREIKDYAKKTFLADRLTMPKITGMALAFAHYYSQNDHLWAPSPSMTAERDALRETATPQYRYVRWFERFFYGYTGVKLLKNDFANFGKIEGEDYDTSGMKTKSLLLKKFGRVSDAVGTKYCLSGYKDYPVVRFIMSDKMYIRKYMGSKNWEEFQNGGGSLVHAMMLHYLEKEEEARQRLAVTGQERTEEELRATVLHNMFKEIEDEQKGWAYER